MVIGSPFAVVPLHWTTVPFSLDVMLNVKVEVISARVVLITFMGLVVFMRVATKLKTEHDTVATLLQLKLLLVTAVLMNWIRAVVGRNGSTIQSKKAPCVTVQVYVTISPGQAPLIPTLESRTIVAAYKGILPDDRTLPPMLTK